MDLLSIVLEYLVRFRDLVEPDAISESIAGDPGIYWLSVIGSALLTGIIYLVLRPAEKKHRPYNKVTYAPATLCLDEERVPLVEDDSKLIATFDDVGVCGRMSITGEVEK